MVTEITTSKISSENEIKNVRKIKGTQFVFKRRFDNGCCIQIQNFYKSLLFFFFRIQSVWIIFFIIHTFPFHLVVSFCYFIASQYMFFIIQFSHNIKQYQNITRLLRCGSKLCVLCSMYIRPVITMLVCSKVSTYRCVSSVLINNTASSFWT
jgi:hypothetical protein